MTGSGRLLVALTGGIASGKSTVGRWLRELGCTVSDSDQLVAELYQPGQPGAEAVGALFSADVLAPDGSVDRQKLADRVFSDSDELRKLETAIHPLVGKAFAELVASSTGIVVYEVPLLAEKGGRGRFDVVVTVESDKDVRLERAIERGVDADSARARMKIQASSESRVALADFVLQNDGGLDELKEQVGELARELHRRLADRKGTKLNSFLKR